jgi:acetyltransferase
MPLAVDANLAEVRAAIDHARTAGRTFITEASAQRVAAAYGIPVPPAGRAGDLAETVATAEQVGYPVVLKIASPDILHKSDIGGIELGIENAAELADAYERIMDRVRQRMADARVWGVMVQRQIEPGREVIIGINRDPIFGPILMFGLGGIHVEVLRDVTFRLCPVTPSDAHEMISEIRGIGLLRGARGQAPADIDAIVDVICRVSALAADFPEVSELDINPLIVLDRGQGAVAADIRIGIGE